MRPKVAFWFFRVEVHSLAYSWTSLVHFTLPQLLKDSDPWSIPIQTLIRFHLFELKTHLKPNMNSGIIYTNHIILPNTCPADKIWIVCSTYLELLILNSPPKVDSREASVIMWAPQSRQHQSMLLDLHELSKEEWADWARKEHWARWN